MLCFLAMTVATAQASIYWMSGTTYGLSNASATWQDAVSACQAEGAKLAEPRTAAQQASLFDALQAVNPGSNGTQLWVWVGASDSANESVWEWASGASTLHDAHTPPRLFLLT